MNGYKMSKKVSPKKERTMFFKYIKDIWGDITLIKERLNKIEEKLKVRGEN